MDTKILKRNHYAAYGEVRSRNNGEKIELKVSVTDERIRAEGIAHDGFEKAFALVPQRDGNWKRVDLGYSGSFYDRAGPSHDSFRGEFTPAWDNVELWDLVNKGIAFGLEVRGQNGEQTTIWLQYRDDNYKIPAPHWD